MLSFIGSISYPTKFCIQRARLWPLLPQFCSALQLQVDYRPGRTGLPSLPLSILFSCPYLLLTLIACQLLLFYAQCKCEPRHAVFCIYVFGFRYPYILDKSVKNEDVTQSLSVLSVRPSFVDCYVSHLRISFGKLLHDDLHMH